MHARIELELSSIEVAALASLYVSDFSELTTRDEKAKCVLEVIIASAVHGQIRSITQAYWAGAHDNNQYDDKGQVAGQQTKPPGDNNCHKGGR